MRLLAGSLLVLALLGCARAQVYDGPARSRCDVARLLILSDGTYFAGPGEVRFEGRILEVDGRPVGRGKTIVDVLPGAHDVRITWNSYEAPGTFMDDAFERRGVWMKTGGDCRTLRVHAEAGKRYVLTWPHMDASTGPQGFHED